MSPTDRSSGRIASEASPTKVVGSDVTVFDGTIDVASATSLVPFVYREPAWRRVAPFCGAQSFTNLCGDQILRNRGDDNGPEAVESTPTGKRSPRSSGMDRISSWTIAEGLSAITDERGRSLSPREGGGGTRGPGVRAGGAE